MILISGSQIYGFENYLSDKIPEFFHSYGFETQFSTDSYYVRNFVYGDENEVSAAFDENQKEIIDEAVNQYLYEKAAIIHDELLFAVENYDESYFNYEYTADAIEIPEESITAPVITQESTTMYSDDTSNSEPLTDENGETVPRNIEAARKVLEKCEGLEFLDYAALVRDSAFTEKEFIYNATIIISENYETEFILTNSEGYSKNEAEIRKQFLAQYSKQKEFNSSLADSEYQYAVSRLSTLKTFKYFVIDENGNTETNIEKDITAEEFKKNALNFPVYILYDDSGISIFGLSADMANSESLGFQHIKNSKIYIYLDTGIMADGNDSYSYLYNTYNKMLNTSARTIIIIAVMSLVSSFILLIAFLCLCGHKNSDDESVLAYIDRLPTDIHFILSIGAVAGLTVLAFWLGIELFESEIYTYLFYFYAPAILSVTFTASYLFFAEWLASTVRIKKAKQKFFSRMLISKLFFAIGRLTKKIFLSVCQLFQY